MDHPRSCLPIPRHAPGRLPAADACTVTAAGKGTDHPDHDALPRTRLPTVDAPHPGSRHRRACRVMPPAFGIRPTPRVGASLVRSGPVDRAVIGRCGR